MFKHFKFDRKVILYISRLLLGCIIVWWTADYIGLKQKVWALISVIIVSEPDFTTVRNTMKSRIINTVSGCVIGLIFISVMGVTVWAMLAGVAVAVLISTSFKKYPTSWKLAPVTVVIVMVRSVTQDSHLKDAEGYAIERTLEVLYGSFVAFALGWIASMFMKRKEIVSSILSEITDFKKTEGSDGHE
jgi:uncharacterized membrane protein YccC